MFRKLVTNHWFPWADLLCVTVALLILGVAPAWGGWPLVLAIIPWFLRLAAGQYPFIKTWFAFPLLIFILTAAVGVWASYDTNGALHKFWQLTGAVFLFLTLAGQPGRNAWILAVLAALVGVGTASYFSLTNDWIHQPGGLGFMNRVGVWLMEVRPYLGLPEISHNFTAGMIAWSTPYLIVLAHRSIRKKKIELFVLAVISGLILAVGFGLAFSRGTGLALAGGLLAWVIWLRVKKASASLVNAKTIFYVLTGMVVLILAGAAWLGMGTSNLAVFSSAQDSLTRLELADRTIKLASDAPYLGSGLNAFAGFYSIYLRGVPNFFISTSLNQYVDVFFEQGILGLLCYGLVYSGCLWMMLTRRCRPAYQSLWMGGVIGLIIACVQGLSSSTFYSAPGSSLAFLPAGMAYSLAAGLGEPNLQLRVWTRFPKRINLESRPMVFGILAVFLLIGIFGGIVWLKWPSIRSAWDANLGVLKMAKVDLADFPSNSWKVKANQEELQPARELFLRSLAANPLNHAANYRLGLLSMNDMQYGQAVAYLEAAYQADLNHRGVVKALGYAHTWNGNLLKARPLLKRIPEAKQELGVYAWWWGTQGRDDLARLAEAAAQQLGN